MIPGADSLGTKLQEASFRNQHARCPRCDDYPPSANGVCRDVSDWSGGRIRKNKLDFYILANICNLKSMEVQEKRPNTMYTRVLRILPIVA